MSSATFYKLLFVGHTEGERLKAVAGVREILHHTLLGARLAVETVGYRLAGGLTLEEAERITEELAQNEIMAEILPDEEATEHNSAFAEVVCPKCGYVGLKITHKRSRELFKTPPEQLGPSSHICQACRESFISE